MRKRAKSTRAQRRHESRDLIIRQVTAFKAFAEAYWDLVQIPDEILRLAPKYGFPEKLKIEVHDANGIVDPRNFWLLLQHVKASSGIWRWDGAQGLGRYELERWRPFGESWAYWRVRLRKQWQGARTAAKPKAQ